MRLPGKRRALPGLLAHAPARPRGSAAEPPLEPGRGRGPDGGPGGPPDLEDLWRDFNRRINRLLGRRGGGGFPPPHRSMRPSGRAAGVVGAVAAIAAVATWVGSGLFIVRDGEVGVVSRFGAVIATEPAGMHWHLPFPFESDRIVDVTQTHELEFGREAGGNGTLLTGDGNIVDVHWSVQYRVGNAIAYLSSLRDPDEGVRQAAVSAMRQAVGGRSLDSLLRGSRATLEQAAQALAQAALDREQAGVELGAVTVMAVQPPAAAQPAFDEAARAQLDTDRVKVDAQSYATQAQARAKGAAATQLQQAQAYKAQVVAQAEGDAARFDAILQQYRKSPEITRQTLYLQTMQQILGSVSKVVVDGGGKNLLVLPLDKPTRTASAPAVPAIPAVPAASVPAAALLTPATPASSKRQAASAAAPAGSGASASMPAAASSRRLTRDRDAR